MLGSSNLDARSSEINEELDVVVYDPEFGRRMEEAFEKDLSQSREYTLEEFKRRGIGTLHGVVGDSVSFAAVVSEAPPPSRSSRAGAARPRDLATQGDFLS